MQQRHRQTQLLNEAINYHMRERTHVPRCPCFFAARWNRLQQLWPDMTCNFPGSAVQLHTHLMQLNCLLQCNSLFGAYIHSMVYLISTQCCGFIGQLTEKGYWVDVDLDGGSRNRAWWHFVHRHDHNNVLKDDNHMWACVSPGWHRSDCDADTSKPSILLWNTTTTICIDVCVWFEVEAFWSDLMMCLNCSV